jgi:hypothetical protein
MAKSKTPSPKITTYHLYILLYLLRAALQGLSARAPARCVEIDAWYTSAKGPIVTHGHTFTGSIPFKDVCQAINEVVASKLDLPVFISLECHVDVDKQPELVKIMEDVWGDKLLKEKLQHLGDRKVSPDALRGRILMMVQILCLPCLGLSDSCTRWNGTHLLTRQPPPLSNSMMTVPRPAQTLRTRTTKEQRR